MVITRATNSLVLLLGFANLAAQAQYRAPKVYNPRIYDGTRRTMSNRAAGRATDHGRKGTTGNTDTSGSQGSTTFVPVDPSTTPRRLALKYAATPAEQRRLETTFSELLQDYRERLTRAGGSLNDVARAAAYLASVSYTVARDRAPLAVPEFNVLRKRMEENFSTDAAFQALSNRDRQNLFEEYGITAAWIDVGYNAVKRADDHKSVKQWQDMARQNFDALMGASPENVIITGSAIEFK